MTYTIEQLEQMMRENGGNLDLQFSDVTSLPNGLTVENDLDLRGTLITKLPDGLIVCGDFYLNYTQITTLPDNLTVGGNLYLDHTPITSLPDNLTVGGKLVLIGTPITSLPNNLTVGDYLDLRDTSIASLPDNLKVGGKIISYYGRIKNLDNYILLQDGDYVEGEYLFADGILTHVKRTKKIGEYTFYIGKIPYMNVVFDGKYYAHCKTFREGLRYIDFKRISDRETDQYRSLTLDSEVSRDEAITMYRAITGACQQGTESFVRNLGDTKDRYTVREIISITQGRYGSRTFAEFFERDD